MTLFDAEVLLRKHDWSKESLLDAWMNDPAVTCENAGIQPPQGTACDHVTPSLCYIISSSRLP